MTYTGVIVYIGETKAVSDKYSLREFVLSDLNEKFPQEVKFQVSQKNCPLLDNYQVGQTITVHYNLRGRRYERNGTTSWFTTVEAWRIEAPTQVEGRTAAEAFEDEIPF